MSTLSRVFSRDVRSVLMIPVAGIICGLELYRQMHLSEKDPSRKCKYAATQTIINAQHVRTLERDGLIVLGCDLPVLNDKSLAAVQKEVQSYFLRGLFSRQANGRKSNVRGDLVCWTKENDEHLSSEMLHCLRLLRGVADALEKHEYAKSKGHYVARHLQLSWYPGDASSCYVRHFDYSNQSILHTGLLGWLRSFDSRQRCLTAILYLNDADWKQSTTLREDDTTPSDGDGGELRCFHPRGHCSEGSYTDIVPRGGTMVIFDARSIEHQVLSSNRDRFALTCWITGSLT